MTLWQSIFGANSLGAASLGVPSSGQNAAPGTGGGQNAGQLEPNTRAGNMAAGVEYNLVPAYPPFVRLANDPNIVYFARFRTLVFGGNGVAAATTNQQFAFSVPTIVLARTGGAYMADNTGLPVGRTGLETFRLQMFRTGSQNDLLDAGGGGVAGNPVTNVLATTVLGTAAQPALIPGNGTFFDVGGFLNVTCQILLNNIEAHVTIWCLEEYGPARG